MLHRTSNASIPQAFGTNVAAEPMPTSDDLRQEAIRATLTRRAGVAPDPKSIAEASIDTWHQVASQLAPVIGSGGVDVLFGRALHRTSIAFTWLTIAEDAENGAAVFASLRARLAGQETAAAVQASTAVLLTFVELLTTLIGESLTERLLSPVWALPTPAPAQETP